MATPNLVLDTLVENQANGHITHNNALNIIDGLIQPTILDRDLTAPPGGESEGDLYLVDTGGSGDWSGEDGNIALFYGGAYLFRTPLEGWRFHVADEDITILFDGTVFNEDGAVSFNVGVTANVTQTQGQSPQTKRIIEVTVCANANDVITLAGAKKGIPTTVINKGANTLQIFPASGDDIDGGATDASVTLAAGATRTFYGVDATSWV